MSRDYKVSVVFCVYAGNEMRDVLPDIKKKIIGFTDQFNKEMLATGRISGFEQAKLILWGVQSSSNLIKESGFFHLPDEKKSFEAAVDAITFCNEKNTSTIALDCLIHATKSNWKHYGFLLERNIIILWTNSGDDNLMVGDKLEEFISGWNNMNSKHKQILLFAPEVYPWIEFAKNIDDAIVYFSDAGKDITEEDYARIIEYLVSGF